MSARAIAVLLCSQTRRDLSAGTLDALGIHNARGAEKYPVEFDPMAVVALLEGGAPSVQFNFTLKLIHPGGRGVVTASTGRYKFSDAGAAEVVIKIERMRFGCPGAYRWAVFVDGAEVGSTPFYVVETIGGGFLPP